MIVEFREKFDKDLLKIDNVIIKKIFIKISEIKQISNLRDLIAIKKLSWYNNFYRIRIWDYRLWFSFDGKDKIILERFLHRKDIYKYFPD